MFAKDMKIAGYDPDLRTDMNAYSPARARALLDLHGYLDRDGDGYRERPDGQPLTREFATGNDQSAKQVNELWKRGMDAIGIRLRFKRAKWPEQLKAARAGKLQMWAVGGTAGAPDADGTLASLYGPNTGRANLSRFDLPEYNRLYEQSTRLPDSPERNALIREMTRLVLAYQPRRLVVYEADRFATDKVVCIDENNPYFRMLHDSWGQKLRQVFDSIEDPAWGGGATEVPIMVSPARSKPLKKITTHTDRLI